MRTEKVPVLVVGAGPVGLSAGMFLAHWGARPLVIDKRDAASALAAVPRANTSLRTLELLRAVGLQPEVEQCGWEGGPPMCSVFKDSGLGRTLYRVGPPPRYAQLLDTCSPVPPRRHLTHDQVQRLALGELRRRGGEARFGVRLVDLVPEADQVRAQVVDARTGEEWEITARYVIGADGANSAVRARLGIPLSDREVIARLNTAFFRADLGPVVEEWGTHLCFVRNDAVYAALISKNGRDQWSSHLLAYPGKPEGLAELTEATTVALLRAAIGDPAIPIELHAVNAWEAAVAMASSFREGRVFLAGDAAHVQSSAGGLGMNTGIQDGHNLAWKIAAVLRGQFAPALLDTYEPERRAAAEASLALSRKMHRGYQSLDGDPNDLYEKVAVDYLRGMMFYGYPAPDSTGAAAPEHHLLNDPVRPGHRFPHRWVNTAETGRDSHEPDRVSTLDLIGSDWTLFAGSDIPRWRATAAALGTTMDMDLRVHELGTVDGAVLVRPDGFVAWCGTSHAALRAALRASGCTGRADAPPVGITVSSR
ncbi:FAD-dependent monooxygenase [Streptomyces sp. GS7]|uniref:FAD-dependent monooxygenase n=1 Tax=Streptomyces sp. GS7 TaxID=2692234 RepID=UPI0013189542|nr:FAD-dependent monooxygenase [Streptomyces sp. GS7]QHC23148.1 FAD-binding monooxygenase [Streptomyces sp. GS7]